MPREPRPRALSFERNRINGTLVGCCPGEVCRLGWQRWQHRIPLRHHWHSPQGFPFQRPREVVIKVEGWVAWFKTFGQAEVVLVSLIWDSSGHVCIRFNCVYVYMHMHPYTCERKRNIERERERERQRERGRGRVEFIPAVRVITAMIYVMVGRKSQTACSKEVHNRHTGSGITATQ